MSRRDILVAIKTRQKELSILFEQLEKSIAKRNQGILVRSKINGKTRYYLRKRGESTRHYLGNNKKLIMENIAQREYEETLLEATKEELSVLNQFLEMQADLRKKHSKKALCNKLPEDIRNLVRTDLSFEDDYVRKWKTARYSGAAKTEYHIYDTLAGEKVRSKSEALIADRLYTAGVPYRYEQKLVFESDIPGPESNFTYYPDFTILNKRTGKLFYWEHLGRLGENAYCKDNLAKLHIYMKHGIIQGKNLLLTYESAERPLLTADVSILIKEYLL